LLILDSSITLDMGHVLGNGCVTSKWYNFLKSAWLAFYTRAGLKAWAEGETSLEGGPSPLRIAGEVAWTLTTDFYKNILANELNQDKVSF
jgi:hypothetical protein